MGGININDDVFSVSSTYNFFLFLASLAWSWRSEFTCTLCFVLFILVHPLALLRVHKVRITNQKILGDVHALSGGAFIHSLCMLSSLNYTSKCISPNFALIR